MSLNVNINVDTAITPSLMVYGENIRLPGLNFDEPLQTFSSQHVNKLINFMRNVTLFKPCPIKHNNQQSLSGLDTCSHVWIRINATRLSLQPFYKGPYLVIERYEKYFKLLIDNKIDSVSKDRIKPAKFLPIEYDTVFAQLVESHSNQPETPLPTNNGNNSGLDLTSSDETELHNSPLTSKTELPKKNLKSST